MGYVPDFAKEQSKATLKSDGARLAWVGLYAVLPLGLGCRGARPVHRRLTEREAKCKYKQHKAPRKFRVDRVVTRAHVRVTAI